MTYPFITIPADQPCYEEVVEMTMEQRRALPARFHTPQWMDSSPGLFMCQRIALFSNGHNPNHA